MNKIRKNNPSMEEGSTTTGSGGERRTWHQLWRVAEARAGGRGSGRRRWRVAVIGARAGRGGRSGCGGGEARALVGSAVREERRGATRKERSRAAKRKIEGRLPLEREMTLNHFLYFGA
jgi:hypothetical protein